VLTDGLQMLSLVYASKQVHDPFFEPMFTVLRSAESEALQQLDDQLHRFLDSPEVNNRTDDDKTLVLATRICALGKED
jgi:hypothetical protein